MLSNFIWVISVVSEAFLPISIVVDASSLITWFDNVSRSPTGLIVIVKVPVTSLSPPFAVPPSSDSVTLTLAAPNIFSSGVNVKVPLESIDGATENKVASSGVKENESD